MKIRVVYYSSLFAGIFVIFARFNAQHISLCVYENYKGNKMIPVIKIFFISELFFIQFYKDYAKEK